MSSILRALKKLESDPRHLEESNPLDSKFMPLAGTAPRKTFPGILLVAIGGGVVCGFVILIGWWFFSQKLQPPPAAPDKISRQSRQQPETAPATPKKLQAPESPAAGKRPGAATDTAATGITANQAPESTAVKIPQPSAPVIEQRIDPQKARQGLRPPQAPSPEIIEPAPAKEAAVATSRPPVVTPKAAAVEIPQLKDPGIRLQAVTWSKEPQKRIAVINNRILRQGDMVSGYLIEAINQDDVVLRQGEERWKVLFRIR